MTRKLSSLAGAIVVTVWMGTPAANGAQQAFDAAPFGLRISDPGDTTYGVRWAEPRKVRRLIVEFAAGVSLPGQDEVHVEYWHRVWDGRPDPLLAETGAGSVGWASVDDWTNGEWKRADATIAAEGNRWIVTFAPTGAREFKDIGEGVGYRKTIQLRLVSDEALPPIAHFLALTDAIVKPLTVRISFGKPAEAIAVGGDEAGRLEVFNGSLGAIRPLPDSGISVGDPGSWILKAAQGAFEADVTMAVDPVDVRYDRTIVTVRSAARPFSFAADEVARGDRVLVDDLGVLVTRGDDAISLDAYRAARKEFPGRTIWNRVADEPEQTLSRAWQDMPLKRPLYFVHGLPGNRNVISQDPNAQVNVSAVPRWFRLPPSPNDTARKLWTGEMLHIDFGFPPDERRGGRELKEGYLPVLRTWWQDGPLYYEATTVLDSLEGDLGSIALDSPTVLLMRIHVANTSDRERTTARLLVTSRGDGRPESLALNGFCAVARDGEMSLVRCLFNASGKGETGAEGQGVRWSLALAPGESHNLYAAVPSITLKDDEPLIESLAHRDFDAACERVCGFWHAIAQRGASIVTPEPWLNDFYAAHARHLLVNCYKEIGSDRLHAHVGTFHYGVYPNESAMMVSDLDRRGYYKEAQQNLDSLLHYQGTVPLPANFQSTDGLFYGDGGHETGGYNKSHGYVMWLMAYHWRMTRDRAWMEAAAPKLIKACEWVMRERRTTMTANADGSRPIECGFLPTGGLEDVQDYWYWLATNAATVWGFEALAAALADFGHPRGADLVREAGAFRDDFTAGITESRIRSPVVRLRDGTYVPKIPSHLHERGRAHGWIRETLEGAIFLPTYELLPPAGVETKWILQDYEDNLYISSNYGYAIPNFDRFWFSRGGFSMQANLLDSPIPYLKRDEIKHYVRTYFNAFTSAFYPEIRMCNEHSLPELGYPAGDHFKSSDEAQSTSWLRLMFVHERDGDLYLGQAIPRYWLADGKTIGIERAASEFGPLAFTMTSRSAAGELSATVTAPTRNPPKTIYVRFRHPEAKRMQSVTVNGQPHDQFNAEKEWVVLAGAGAEKLEIVVRY